MDLVCFYSNYKILKTWWGVPSYHITIANVTKATCQKKTTIGVPISNLYWIPKQLPMPLLTSIEKHGLKELTPLSLLHFSLFMCTKGKDYNYSSTIKGGIYHLCQISKLIESDPNP